MNPNDNNIINLRRLQEPQDPLAAQLKAAMQKQNDPNTPRIVAANAQGKILPPEPPAEPSAKQELILTPFSDGILFKAMPNQLKPGTYVIVDGAGVHVALARDGEVSDIICRGVDMFYRTVQEQSKQAADAVVKPEEAK